MILKNFNLDFEPVRKSNGEIIQFQTTDNGIWSWIPVHCPLCGRRHCVDIGYIEIGKPHKYNLLLKCDGCTFRFITSGEVEWSDDVQ